MGGEVQKNLRFYPKKGKKKKKVENSVAIILLVNLSVHLSVSWGFFGGSVVEKLPANAEYMVSIPGSGRFPGGGNGNSSTPALEIPWTEESGGIQFMGLQRTGHNLATKQQQQTCILGTLCECKMAQGLGFLPLSITESPAAQGRGSRN